MLLGMEIGLSPGDFVLDVYPVPPPQKGAESPNFWPTSIVAKRLHGSRCRLVRARRRPMRHSVRWGPSSPPLNRHSPQFSAIGRCGQTAGWTKMPLGMEVGLGPGDVVFDGDPANPEKWYTHPHPIFGPCLWWPKATLY